MQRYDPTDLSDRMKRYEASQRFVLPRRTYTLIRVDGRAFHTYMRNAEKPFDYTFVEDMNAVGVEMCREISGAVMAFVQSDEISILTTDIHTHNTEPWFGGVVQKMCSIAAAKATAELMWRRHGDGERTHWPLFDARVFTMSDQVEVANYFIWRQRDAIRNSVTMVAQNYYSHAQLHNVGVEGRKALLLADHDVDWNGYPQGVRQGRLIARVQEEDDSIFKSWAVQPAPTFTTESSNVLTSLIPAMPRLWLVE